MNEIHPTFAPFLASIAPPPSSPKRHRIKGLHSFTYTLSGVLLRCEIDWEAGEKSTSDSPGYPESAVLYSAETKRGYNITELLSLEQQGEIEAAFLKQGSNE
jgi:hypothetical protein